MADIDGMVCYARLSQSLRRLVTSPVDELNRAQFWLRYAIDLVRHCTQELHQDRAAQMAAALTYYTLFSLLPTAVVVLVVLHSFVGESDREQFKKSAVNWMVEWIDSGQPAVAPVPADSDQPMTPPEITTIKQREYEQVRHQINERFQEQIDKLSKVNFGSIGVVGVLVLIYGATTLLATVERSFNTIFGTNRARPWYIRLPLYYTVITLGPLVLLVGQWLQREFLRLVSSGQSESWAAALASTLWPLLAAWIVLALMYTLVPNTSVRIRTAMIGSFVAAVLWVIAIELLTGYMGQTATTTFYGAVYGALALLPLFLLWLWLTWLIILFGLELSYTLQTLRGRQLREEQDRTQVQFVGDPLWVVPVMTRISQAFVAGKTVSGQALADELNLPVRAVQHLSDCLESEGLIHEVERNHQPVTGYTLAVPPENIPIAKLLGLGRRMTQNLHRGTSSPGWDMVDRLIMTHKKAVVDMSLAGLLKQTLDSQSSDAESKQEDRK